MFPSVDDSVHYIGYDEMITGMEHLANKYSNRLNFYSVGQSVGYHKLLSGDVDRNKMWVAELTNNINDVEAFAEKPKAVYAKSYFSLTQVNQHSRYRYSSVHIGGPVSLVAGVLLIALGIREYYCLMMGR